MRQAMASERKSLLGSATKVADLKAWQEGHGSLLWDRAGNSYDWITANQLLIFRFMGVRRNREIWRLSSRNRANGKETPLPALSAKFNESYGVHGRHSISPDGQWLLWMGEKGHCAAMLDGSHFITWQSNPKSGYGYGEADWLGDSRHWVERIRGTDGRVKGFIRHDVLTHREQERIKLRPADPLHIRSGSPYSIPMVAWDNHILVATSGWPESYSQSYVIQIGIGARAHERTYLVKAPKGWLFKYWPTLSHSGKRVAWECQPQNPSEVAKAEASLWVSDIDGHRMHQIGSIENEKYNGIIRVKWLPDGQHLSFEYRRALYVVSAE
ncbi:hypothetical protein IAD21_01501 [Abditibacteriota bacterium]|nr:hypothetical protein IAD21_01501 [Abditibacteriota bacterium]